MKAKNIRRAMLLSALSVLLCVSMLIGTTFAWFTDSVTSGSNIIKSGNLDIVLEYWDGDSWENAEGKVIPFVTADNRAQNQILWEPGCTYELAPFRVRNEGNLALKYEITINGVTGDAKLLEVIEFTANDDAISTISGHLDTKGAFSEDIVIKGHMKEEAGNEYQNLTIEGISVTVVATQQTYESDSFNKYYDQGAQLPTVTYKYIDENATEATELGNGKVAVTVPAGAPKGGYQVVVSNENTTTDANGQTTFSADIDLLKDGEKVQANGTTTYLVRINVGTDLLIAKVLHKGEEITNYTYASGIISFETASFSPFAVVYQQIPADATNKVVDANGKTEYFTTLNEAFEAISGKATITARNDMVLTETAVLAEDAEIVLDLNGKTLSGEVDALLKLTAGKVTIKNGTIKNVHAAATETKYSIYMAGNAVAEIKDVNIETTGVGIYMTDNAHITELNAKIESVMNANGYCCFDAISLDGNARIDEITGGEYINRYDDAFILSWYEDPKHNYSATQSWTVNVNGENASIGTISGGTFLGIMDKGFNGAVIHVNNGKVELISGGYFGFVKTGLTNPEKILYAGFGTIEKITGGTFEKGSFSTGYGCDFETIVSNSGCEAVQTGETVNVNIQFSTKVMTYTLGLVEVSAA